MKTAFLGRVLGAVGLIMLLTSVITYFLFQDLPMFTGVKLLVGIALVVAYFATNFRNLGDSIGNRGGSYMAISLVSLLALSAAVAGVNYIAVKNPKSWDLTKNKIHTLSPDTVKTLQGLKEEITVTAFYVPSEPKYDELDELLKRYRGQSEKLVYKFVDPRKDPLSAKAMNVKESGPRVIVARGHNEARVQETTEEALTNALVKVTHGGEKKIYFTTGHGELDPDDSGELGYSEAKKRMENEGLKAEKLNLASNPEVPKDAQTVVVAGGKVAFQPGEVETLRKYLNAGGKAFVMLEPGQNLGLDPLLKEQNVQADDSLVVDPLSRLFGASPVIPVVQEYGPHEITRDFKLNTVFPTCRPLTVLKDNAAATAAPLALSMPSAWGETKPDVQPLRHDDGERSGPFPLVVTVTRNTASTSGKRSDEMRLVVSGDSEFASNKFRSAFGNEDFFLNSVSWLSDQSERITIRPRMRDASRIFLTPLQSAFIRMFSFEVMPLGLVIAGLAVWLVRRSK